jgi:hypothetical protein
MSATDKVILDNITSLTQSLTNKGITGSTNYVDANGLKTTTNPVFIVATAPSVNQVLMAVSATQATWQTISTGTPSTIGTVSQIGTSSNFARQDHIHAHGDQLGGTLHATASQSIAGFMSATDKTNLDNITSSTQSLTNKTIIGTTNYVDANGLKTTTNPVLIVATAPSIGQSLIAVSATAATWQTPQSASSQKTPADPTTTTSTVGVMMGLSASITPVLTGKIMIIISGDIENDTNSRGARVQIRTGTGTPPINGAALTGTTQGGLVTLDQSSPNLRVPFSLNAIVNSLTLNTAVWVDISLASITSGISRVRDISISVVEL